jgi:hypothetical protein
MVAFITSEDMRKKLKVHLKNYGKSILQSSMPPLTSEVAIEAINIERPLKT